MDSKQRQERSWVVSVGLIFVMLAISLPMVVASGYDIRSLTAVIGLCVLSGLAWRFPVLGGSAYLILLVVWYLAIHRAVGPVSFGFLIPLVALASASRPWAFLGLATSLIAVLTAFNLRGEDAATAAPVSLVFFLVAAGAAYLAGRVIVFWRDRVDRELQRQEARIAEERRQLARDLHDTIVYATTTMVMRTEELRRRPDVPADVSDELAGIADTGRASTRNLRSMLSLLRESGDMPAGRTLTDGTLEVHLQGNVDRLREAGFDANANSNGDVSSLTPEQADVIAAVAVEASSNIIKHGDRRVPCALLLDVSSTSCEFAALNGISSVAQVSEHEPMGLVGMRERVENIGGDFSAGRVGDSFVVEVKLSR